jgi:hypothetical protein
MIQAGAFAMRRLLTAAPQAGVQNFLYWMKNILSANSPIVFIKKLLHLL